MCSRFLLLSPKLGNTNIYVFISDDRKTFQPMRTVAICLWPTGPWVFYEVIPMTPKFFARYSCSAAIAHTNLIMRGYHLVEAHGTHLFDGDAP